MASGRLGSAYIEPFRTVQLYNNSSGGAASLSLLAQVKSSTSNVAISAKIDGGSTAAETTAQIDSNSYNKETLKLLYNNNTTPTSTIGKIAYASYSTANSDTSLTVTPFPSGTAAGTDGTGHSMPWCGTTKFTDWGYAPQFPIYWEGSAYVRYYNEAAAAAGGFNFFAAQVNKNWSPWPSQTHQNTSISYYNRGACADPYCIGAPVFLHHSNAYQTVVYYTGDTSNTRAQESTSSLYRQQINSNDPGSNERPDKLTYASGGMAVFTHTSATRYYFVYYGRNPANTDVFGNVIRYPESTFNAAGQRPLWIRSDPGAGIQHSSGYPLITFHEYHPTKNKIYSCATVKTTSGYKKALLEWQCDALDAYMTANQATTNPIDYWDTAATLENLIEKGWVLDKTDNLPTEFLTFQSKVRGSMKRFQKDLWAIKVKSIDGTNKFYQTSDFENWTEISSSTNYEEIVSADVQVKSTGSVTNSTASNFDTLPDAGLIEHQTSVNNYERTGLVMSNNDKLYVRNHSDTAIAVQAMGYEET